MKSYYTIILLLLTSSFGALAQETKLKLACIDSMSYYEKDGISFKTVNRTDYSGDTVQISHWLQLTKVKSTQLDTLRTKITINNDDTVRRVINFKQYDSNFNLVLETDTTNNRLTKKLNNKFVDTKLMESSNFYLQISYSGDGDVRYAHPVNISTFFFYRLNETAFFKRIEVVNGNRFFYSSDPKPDTTISFYEYNSNRKILKSTKLQHGDTTVTHNKYHLDGKLLSSESKSPFSISHESIEYDNQQRVIRSVYKTDEYVDWLEENTYDDSGNIIVKFRKGKFWSSREENTYNSQGKIIKQMTYENR